MRKVLILTYYWPPAGGPGVQRILKFAKYLPEFGWEPVILSVENGDYPAIDESLCWEIPDGLQVYKTRTVEPFTTYRKITGKNENQLIPTYILNKDYSDNWRNRLVKWVRANFFLPDARLGWIPFAWNVGRKIINAEGISIILASSPPHSLQFIGRALSHQLGCKWVADLRDPWTEAFWQRDLNAILPARYINQLLEKSILNSADALITVSESLANLFREKTSKNCYVIPNGFDSEDFNDIKRTHNSQFTITYSGSLGKDQPLTALLKAINRLEAEIIDQIKVNIYGNIHSCQLAEIEAFNRADIITVMPYLPHRELITRIVNSDILLLVIPNTPNNKGILTGKIFEYLATGNFILGIGPEDCDAARLLAETNAGVMFSYSADLKEVILEHFRMWKKEKKTIRKTQNIEKYTRRHLTGELAKVLESQLV
ncbi:MAG TPA: glycosyltransferase family 4 protein [Candidatus Marinimicrobia bacterium]|nr:glycosyltransferase family 4 protein [Candidatus Neomarinimicrobiota bacterium]